MTEQQLLVDCVRRLNQAGLAYCLTGSMASNYWGVPRTTHDLDFVVQIPPSSVPKLVQSFAGDFYVDEAAILAAYRPPWQFNLIDTRSALKVDFWMLKAEAFDRELFRRRLAVRLFGEQAWIATAEDVILHKLFWDRLTPSERQLGDAAGIVAIQGTALDREYLLRWAAHLHVETKLELLMTGRIQPKTT